VSYEKLYDAILYNILYVMTLTLAVILASKHVCSSETLESVPETSVNLIKSRSCTETQAEQMLHTKSSHPTEGETCAWPCLMLHEFDRKHVGSAVNETSC